MKNVRNAGPTFESPCTRLGKRNKRSVLAKLYLEDPRDPTVGSHYMIRCTQRPTNLQRKRGKGRQELDLGNTILSVEMGLEKFPNAPIWPSEFCRRCRSSAGLIKQHPHGAQGISITIHRWPPHVAQFLLSKLSNEEGKVYFQSASNRGYALLCPQSQPIVCNLFNSWPTLEILHLITTFSSASLLHLQTLTSKQQDGSNMRPLTRISNNKIAKLHPQIPPKSRNFQCLLKIRNVGPIRNEMLHQTHQTHQSQQQCSRSHGVQIHANLKP